MQATRQPASLISGASRIRIIGQGLTGSLMALMLKDRGVPFVVQDTFLPGAATMVAPGIVNPMAGRNFRPPARIHMLLEEVRLAMDLVESRLGVKIWTPCPILRMFAEPTQVDRFEKSLEAANGNAFVEKRFPPNHFSHVNDVFGSFLTGEGGWANLPRLIRVVREWLEKENALDDSEWTGESPTNADEALCFCDGWRIANLPEWNFIPHNPAKGEMLIVRFEDDLPRDWIYNQSCWVQPVEKDLWRVGATYSWDSFNSESSLNGAEDLQERLHLLTATPFHVEDQVAGVRPIVEDYRPVIGQHPEKKNWFVLNAMGSKGVLQAPAAARVLIDHMLEGKGIPPDLSVRRFL